MELDRKVARYFAEMMLFWRGHLRAREIQDFLGVSERTARSLISDWRDAGILPRYRPGAERCLVPVEEFDPGPSVTDPNTALFLLLTADCLPGNPFSMTAPHGGGHDLSLSASTRSRSVRVILAACLERQAVSLIYAAKTGRQDFVFCPSAVVRSRGRYHLRGYRAEGRDALGNRLDDRYVDVVPARAFEAWPTGDFPFVDLEDDSDWHTFEKRTFLLWPGLSQEERLCYEHEYGIANTGKLLVLTRQALMPYVVQELSERRCWRSDGTSVPIWDTRDPRPQQRSG